MKILPENSILFLFSLAMGGILITSTLVKAEMPDPQRKFPSIMCDQPMYDFGVMDNHRSVEHVFTIWNKGNAPLEIDRVRACCGASAKIADKTILPGTNTTVRVNLSLRGRKGELRKSFYVVSNDSKQQYYQLQLVGTSVAIVDIQPQVIDFGCISPDTVVTTNVNIVCRSNLEFNITNVTCTVPQFTVVSHGKVCVNSHCLQVKTVPPLAPGVTRGKVRVYTDHSEYREIVIPVIATVAMSDILVVPRELVLMERGKKPEPITRYIAIRSRGKRPFKILKVDSPGPNIEVKLTPLGSSGYRCELKDIIPFPDLDGKNIVIVTDHESVSNIVIPIRVPSKKEVTK